MVTRKYQTSFTKVHPSFFTVNTPGKISVHFQLAVLKETESLDFSLSFTFANRQLLWELETGHMCFFPNVWNCRKPVFPMELQNNVLVQRHARLVIVLESCSYTDHMQKFLHTHTVRL